MSGRVSSLSPRYTHTQHTHNIDNCSMAPKRKTPETNADPMPAVDATTVDPPASLPQKKKTKAKKETNQPMATESSSSPVPATPTPAPANPEPPPLGRSPPVAPKVKKTKTMRSVDEPPADVAAAVPPAAPPAAAGKKKKTVPAEPPAPMDVADAGPPAGKKKKTALAEDAKPAKPAKKARKVSAYDLFRGEFTTRAKESDTAVPFGELSKQCAQAWAQLEDKTEWQTRADAMHAERIKDEPPKVKRPPTAWMNFLQHYRGVHKDKNYSVPEFAQHAGAEWKTMSDEAKTQWKTPETTVA